jgi:hypothetical protein
MLVGRKNKRGINQSKNLEIFGNLYERGII